MHPKPYPLAGLIAHEGRIANQACILVECGIGKVAAATAAQALVERGIQRALVLGIAGGIAPNVHLGDVLVVHETVHHDLDARPFFPRAHVPHLGLSAFTSDESMRSQALVSARAVASELLGERPGLLAGTAPQVHTGTVLTGDQVIDTRPRRESLRKEFPGALGVDMETVAVAQVCHQNGISWAAIRIVSDGLDDLIDPQEVLAYASSKATAALRDIVVNMLEGAT